MADAPLDPLSAVLLSGPVPAAAPCAPDGDSEGDEPQGLSRASARLERVLQQHSAPEGFVGRAREFVGKMESAITRSVPGATVEVYGSVAVGTHLAGSDVDVVVTLASVDAADLLARVQAAIAAAACGSTVPVPGRVPLLRVRTPLGVDCDVTFNRQYGPQNTRLLSDFADKLPQFRTLSRLVKLWTRVRCLPDSRDEGPSSYTWVLLSLQYCQHQERVGAPREDDWAKALHGFFWYWLRFDASRHVACVRTDVPGHLTREAKKWFKQPCERALAIEDPVETWRDLGRMVSPDAWEQIFAEIARGYVATAHEETAGSLLDSAVAVIPTPPPMFLVATPSQACVALVSGPQRVKKRTSKHSREECVCMSDVAYEVEVLRPLRLARATKGGQRLVAGDPVLARPCSLVGPLGQGGDEANDERVLSEEQQQVVTAAGEAIARLCKLPIPPSSFLEPWDGDAQGDTDHGESEGGDGSSGEEGGYSPRASKRARLN